MWRAYFLCILILCSCSKGRESTISREDLRSEIKVTLSYAAMLNFLLHQHAQSTTTITFDSVQAHYLADELSSERSTLGKQKPLSELERQYAVCMNALSELETAAKALVQTPVSVPLRDSIAKLTYELLPALTEAEQTL